MELSPLEIKSQKFSRRLKGYDTTEVDNFLELIAKDLEKLYGEFYNLKEEIVKKNQEIKEFKEKDKMISDAVLMVRSIGDEIKTAAKSEAESIKNNAIMEAKRITDEAYAKYSEIYLSANELLNKRVLILNSMKNLLSTNIDLVNVEESKKLELSLSVKDKKIVDNLADALKTDNNRSKITDDKDKEGENGASYTETKEKAQENNKINSPDATNKTHQENNNLTHLTTSNNTQNRNEAPTEKKIEDGYNTNDAAEVHISRTESDKALKNEADSSNKSQADNNNDGVDIDNEELEKLLGDVNKFTF
jgi:cell division initiation protein